MAPATPVIQLIRLNAPRASLPKFVNQFRRTFALGNQSPSPLPSSPASLHCRTLSTAAPIHTGTSSSTAKWLGRNSNSSSRAYSNSSEYRLFPVGYQLPLIDYLTLANFAQKSNLRSQRIRQLRHCYPNSFHKHLRMRTAMQNKSAKSARRMRLRRMSAPGSA